MNQHKNSQKRKFEDYSTYFVTTVTYDRIPYFKNYLLCELFIEELRICKELKQFLLHGFIILPDHVHLLITPDKKYNLSEIMRSLKGNFSRNINVLLEGDVTSRRLHFKHNKLELYFQKLADTQSALQNQQKIYFKWQKSFHDHYIRNQNDFKKHMHYMNHNYLKHGIAKEYKFIGYNYSDMLDL